MPWGILNEFKELPVIYVAGPFTADTPRAIELNVRDAETAGLQLADLGASACVPHTQGRFLVGTCTPEYWYNATMSQMLKCDAAYFMPDVWKASTGARAEHDRAKEVGLPCLYTLTEAAAWILAWEQAQQ